MVSDNSHTSVSTSSSTLSLELDLCASEDYEPIHLDAPVSHSFTNGTNFNINQNFEGKDELRTTYSKLPRRIALK